MKMRSWLAVLCLPSAVLARREPLRQPTAVPSELAVASGSWTAPRARCLFRGRSAYLRSAMSPDSLLAHDGRQLADSGWMAMPERTFSVARFWTRTDTAGKASVIRLTVNASSENRTCRDVNLMRYPREP